LKITKLIFKSMEKVKTIKLKCAGCGQSFSAPNYLVVECDLYVCGIGGCDVNALYIIPEMELRTTVIIPDAGVKLNGIQYRVPTRGDVLAENNSKKNSILRKAEKMQNSKLN
jgi:hypothetical protein